jgi:hypothetical protein
MGWCKLVVGVREVIVATTGTKASVKCGQVGRGGVAGGLVALGFGGDQRNSLRSRFRKVLNLEMFYILCSTFTATSFFLKHRANKIRRRLKIPFRFFPCIIIVQCTGVCY